MLDNSLERLIYIIMVLLIIPITLILLMPTFHDALNIIFTADEGTEEVSRDSNVGEQASDLVFDNNYVVNGVDNWKVKNNSLDVFYENISDELILDLEYLNSKIEKDFVVFPILDDSLFSTNSNNLEYLNKFKSNKYIPIGVVFDRAYRIREYIALDYDMDSKEYTKEFEKLLSDNQLREDINVDADSREISNYLYSTALKENEDLNVAKNGMLQTAYTHESYEYKIRSDKLLKNMIKLGLIFITIGLFSIITVNVVRIITKNIEIKKLNKKYPNFAQLQKELKTFNKNDLNGINYNHIWLDKIRESDIVEFSKDYRDYLEKVDLYFDLISSEDTASFYKSLSKIKLIYGDAKLKNEFISSDTFVRDKAILLEDLLKLNNFLSYYPDVLSYYETTKEKTSNKLKLEYILKDGVDKYSTESIESLLRTYMNKKYIKSDIQQLLLSAIYKREVD